MEKKTRDSNIELLRILTICGVVVLHYNGNVAFSYVQEGSVNFYILYALEGLFICAVDLFVLISGYFLSGTGRRRSVKAVELIVQVMVIGVVKYLATCVVNGNPVSVKSLGGALLPNNYLVTLYITLYLLSPYINLALGRLTDKQYGILTGLCVLLFSVWPTLLDTISAVTGYVFSGLYTTNSGGSQYGYSLLNFMLLYLIGGFLRRVGAGGCTLKKCPAGILLLVCSGLLTLWQTVHPQIARAYCNPLVIAEAVLLFLLFQRIHFFSGIVNLLARGAFTCFLLHDVFLWYIGIEKVVVQSPWVMLGHLFLTVPLIYLVSWLVWRIFDWITGSVFRWAGKKLHRLDAIISVDM